MRVVVNTSSRAVGMIRSRFWVLVKDSQRRIEAAERQAASISDETRKHINRPALQEGKIVEEGHGAVARLDHGQPSLLIFCQIID
jgi:hypothetical protein